MKSTLFIFLLLCSAWLRGQSYPVHISNHLTPPYSGYLADYADPASEKLKLILQLNDFSVPQTSVKLKFEIKGDGFTLSTKTFYNPAPITLQPGQPYLLTGENLSAYLSSNNLDFTGISLSQYEQLSHLPEGYYSICVTAYDYYNATPIQVSNEACSMAWFTLSDPPFLNAPLCGSVVSPLYPQNIVFQWAAMNLGSPNSALNTEYEFALWECRPDSTANPNQVVLSTAPIFSFTTQQTVLNYGITEPALNLYMKYIWRVRAKDISGKDLFKNQGFSQICTFKYGNPQNVINGLELTLNAEAINHRMGRCNWNKQSLYTNYLLQVRKAGTSEWFDYHNTSGDERIMNLEPLTQYEARVRGEGNGITGDWSNTAMFTTLQAPEYSCNNQSMPVNGKVLKPLPLDKAVKGLIIQSGQFEVHVTQIYAGASLGWYGGKGYVTMMGVKKVPVKWSHIYIDDTGRQQQGVIEAETKGIENWAHQWDVTEAENNATYVNGPIDSVYINGNQMCYTLSGNTIPICVPTPTGANVMVIRDADGNQYEVNLAPPPPKITGPTNYFEFSDDSLDATDNKIVNFLGTPNQAFGFDKKQYAAFYKNYEIIKLKNGKNYFVSNKSIGLTQSDNVWAQVEIDSFDQGLLKFKTKAGAELQFTSAPQGKFLISGITDNVVSIYAVYNNKRIGKLNITPLKALTKKVVVVPVNGAPIPSNISVTINGIFKQANVTWTVSTAPNFSFGLGGDGLDAADATLFSKYSPEMRALRDAYKQHDSLYDKNAYYLFVVSGFNNPDLKGYMVRGRAVGFISQNATGKEIAHELAHGAFALEHTFPAIEKSSSNNLMDYGTGYQMVKEQWMSITNGTHPLLWYDDEESAAVYGNGYEVVQILKKVKDACSKRGSLSLDYFKAIYGEQKEFLGQNIATGTNSFKILNVHFRKSSSIDFTKDPMVDKIEIINNANIIYDENLVFTTTVAQADSLVMYLKAAESNNILLFVNGYRFGAVEPPNSSNIIRSADPYDYWAGIDTKFSKAIGTNHILYADGHQSITSSNHNVDYDPVKSQSEFARNMFQYHCTADGTAWQEFAAGIGVAGITSMVKKFLHVAELIDCNNYYTHKNLLQLHTTSNTQGFVSRRSNGYIAGTSMVSDINAGRIKFDKTTGKIDIVAHSMGYAYSLGLISALKQGGFATNIGRYYILAPENACCSSYGVNMNDFEEIWQYGSNESSEVVWQQDGVAPQCKVTGLDAVNRIEFPRDGSVERGFVLSHSIASYYWIFTKLNGRNGEVKHR